MHVSSIVFSIFCICYEAGVLAGDTSNSVATDATTRSRDPGGRLPDWDKLPTPSSVLKKHSFNLTTEKKQ